MKTDNIGAMFMAQNSSSGVRTRHVDTRYHYIRENVEDGIIKIEFVRSMENDSDIFTKNVTQEIYEKHVRNFLEDTTISNDYPTCLGGYFIHKYYKVHGFNYLVTKAQN